MSYKLVAADLEPPDSETVARLLGNVGVRSVNKRQHALYASFPQKAALEEAVGEPGNVRCTGGDGASGKRGGLKRYPESLHILLDRKSSGPQQRHVVSSHGTRGQAFVGGEERIGQPEGQEDLLG